MLGLSGILHMGAMINLIELPKKKKKNYLFPIIWNKIEQFRFETAIEPWS